NAGKSTVFNITWNHGTTLLHAGDAIVVKACVNQTGDEVPSNNCGTVVDPPGRIVATAAPKAVTVKSQTTSTAIGLTFTNSSAFKLRPIRIGENVKVTVTVGTAAAQTAVAMARDPFALAAGATTNGTFTWTHGTLAVGKTVTIKVCAVVTGNTAPQ